MRLFLVDPIGPFPAAIGNNFNTFTTRQDVSPTPLPTVLPGQLQIGSRIVIQSNGEFSTTGTPTLSLGTYIGTQAAVITTVIAEYTAAATGSGAASWPWWMEWMGIVTAVGTAGSVTGSGFVVLGSSLVATTTLPIPSTLALRTITWDTTIARAVGVCATFGTSNAANNVRTYNHSVTLIN